jgi:hypothetical protein
MFLPQSERPSFNIPPPLYNIYILYKGGEFPEVNRPAFLHRDTTMVPVWQRFQYPRKEAVVLEAEPLSLSLCILHYFIPRQSLITAQSDYDIKTHKFSEMNTIFFLSKYEENC